MTLPVNYQQQPIPNHSGITINISNPVMNPPGYCTHPQCQHNNIPPIQTNQCQHNNDYVQEGYATIHPQAQINYPTMPQGENQAYGMYNAQPQPQKNISYPPQYYMNNYNYINNPQNNPVNQATMPETINPVNNNSAEDNLKPLEMSPNLAVENNPAEDKFSPESQMPTEIQTKDADLSLSKEIINNLDEQKAALAEATKNEKKVKVVALTNEYIMSLEDYLNNPNNDIRYTAAKEILTRLDEDRSRYNDAALNALLNKMLQDPDKSIRVAAMSAFSSELASGNEFTVKLLKDIQNNPNADKDDIVEAANILLKMSASTEYKTVPMNDENLNLTPPTV